MEKNKATIMLILTILILTPYIIIKGDRFEDSNNDTNPTTLERYRQGGGAEVFRVEEQRRLCEDFCISEGYTNNTG